ncbi:MULTISPECIES: hypothetical protein [unclassified Bradyrhizobium]|uniref:hypothetical protein n=1 Tax=unclassified Bradyrhizobium TaxID=2631580 RepID=UPI003399379F
MRTRSPFFSVFARSGSEELFAAPDQNLKPGGLIVNALADELFVHRGDMCGRLFNQLAKLRRRGGNLALDFNEVDVFTVHGGF